MNDIHARNTHYFFRKPIVRSLLETNLCKLSMLQSFLINQRTDIATYAFVCRNVPAYSLTQLIPDIERELDHLCSLKFEEDEIAYLHDHTMLDASFVQWLSGFTLKRELISVSNRDGTLHIEVKGPLIDVTLFEIHVSYIVSELYFGRFNTSALLGASREHLIDKIKAVKQYNRYDGINRNTSTLLSFEFVDFGLRRRWSSAWQEEFIETMLSELPLYFKGTSNVYLAKKFNIAAIGTMAHEYLQSYQVFSKVLRDFQVTALRDWLEDVPGYAMALTDTISMDAFLRDFDLHLTTAYDGMMHNSGCPYVWGYKALKHYVDHSVDTRTKKLAFSSNLDLIQALQLHQYFGHDIQTSFRIGTNFTNDNGIEPLNMVMMLMSVNDKPVAKLSDSPGKTLCHDADYIKLLASTFDYSSPSQ